MVQVIRLGLPAGRQFGGERGVDEAGDGGGVRAAGVPLQGEWDELRWLGHPDESGGVRGCEGWDEQDPVNVSLADPAGGGQFGVGEVDGGRADARLFEGLPLAERPGREQVLRTGAENIVSQVRQRERVLTGEAVVWPQPDQERFGQNTSLAIPSGAGIRPQVMATSMRPEMRASVIAGSHIRWRFTVTCGASVVYWLMRCGARTGATGGVIPSRTVPASPAATRRTAASAAATSSRMTFDRASSSAPALVIATRRVVRVSSDVPSSRSRRRISSLRVGVAMCRRSAARPK